MMILSATSGDNNNNNNNSKESSGHRSSSTSSSSSRMMDDNTCKRRTHSVQRRRRSSTAGHRRHHRKGGGGATMNRMMKMLTMIGLILVLLFNNDNDSNGGSCNSQAGGGGSRRGGGLTTLVGLPTMFACAAYTRQGQQPTKELDKSSSGSTTQLVEEGDDSKKPTLTLNQILRKAGKKGLGGGIPGFVAGVVQVLSLMWLRTIINYQCRYGTSFKEAFVTLQREGGINRFYRGLTFALVQAPLARFVSTASNDGVEAFVAAFPLTKNWGPGRTTIIASVVVGLWRIALMPVDTCKTVLQVDSLEGFRNLMRRVKAGRIEVLYQGSIAMAISASLAHYPWFYTYNLLSKSQFVNSLISSTLLRNAGIGVMASIVSDTLVNSVRVIKTMKQAMGSKHDNIGYLETIRMILAADGWKGLLGRGLQTRIYANALQSLVFTVIWRGLADYWGRPSNRSLSEPQEKSSGDMGGDETGGGETEEAANNSTTTSD